MTSVAAVALYSLWLGASLALASVSVSVLASALVWAVNFAIDSLWLAGDR